MTNVLRLLTNDHERVRKLLWQLFYEEQPTRRIELVGAIRRELTAHRHVEEAIFYPAYRQWLSNDRGDDVYFESLEEHRVVDRMLQEFDDLDPETPQFKAKARVLKDLIEQHAENEEEEIFAHAQGIVGEDELNELGERIQHERGASEPRLAT